MQAIRSHDIYFFLKQHAERDSFRKTFIVVNWRKWTGSHLLWEVNLSGIHLSYIFSPLQCLSIIESKYEVKKKDGMRGEKEW